MFTGFEHNLSSFKSMNFRVCGLENKWLVCSLYPAWCTFLIALFEKGCFCIFLLRFRHKETDTEHITHTQSVLCFLIQDVSGFTQYSNASRDLGAQIFYLGFPALGHTQKLDFINPSNLNIINFHLNFCAYFTISLYHELCFVQV